MKEHERIQLEYVKTRYSEKYPDNSTFQFNTDCENYQNNISSYGSIDVMQYNAEFFFKKAFECLKINENTENFTNKMIKILHGKYEVEPVLSTYPNIADNKLYKTINFKIRGLDKNLNLFESNECIIIYKPNELCLNTDSFIYYIDYLSSNIWDQDLLAKAIFDKVFDSINTKDIYIKLKNVHHLDTTISSEYFDGIFNNLEVRKCYCSVQ